LTRTTNTFRNLLWAFTAQFILLALGLVMPRLIILTYGSSVNGLTATINQILNVLNLLQAGAVGASIFAMFKPVADKNYQQMSLIIRSSKRYFNRLGWVFLLLIFIIAPIVGLNKSGNEITFEEIIFAFLILGVNVSFSFFFLSVFDIVFSSDQKRYILSISAIIQNIVYFSLLFIIISFHINFIFMYLSVLAGTCIKVIYLYLIFRKQYADKLVPVSKDEAISIPNRGYLLINQISTQAVESSPTILIAFNYDFKLASVYSIYYLVMSLVKMVITTIQVSVSEIFGNLVVSEDKKRVESVFNLMQFIYIIIGTFLSTCTAFLIMPFISLYTRGMTDVNYSIPLLAVFTIFYFLVYSLYMPYYTLSNVYGLYKETYVQSLISGIIALIISFILSRYTSMSFVLLGLILYYLSSMICRFIIIKTKIDWFTLKKLPVRLVLFILFPLLAFYLQQHVFINYMYTWVSFISISIITAIIAVVIIALYILIFEMKEYRQSKGYFTMFIKSRTTL
jgi:O-antigen/teichoic acid export membrane protein